MLSARQNSADCKVAKEAILSQLKDRVSRNTSRLFVLLLIVQWLGAIIAAAVLSPQTWKGASSSVHPHIFAAILLGGVITSLPLCLALLHPTRALTRHTIAIGQMCMSALLIHITGGRVETHFHVFGSLAILSFFRDYRVLMTATVVVYIDHLVRGYYWPQSVYGTANASPWRALEHAWWVGFEVLFLCLAIKQSTAQMEQIADRQVALESTNARIEAEVKQRTAQLESANKQMETFCYSMSHDLKAPLRGIQAFSGLLNEDHGHQLDTEGKQLLNRIERSAKRMNSLIEDLLEYTRVSTAKLQIAPVDLSFVVQDVLRLLAVEIEQQKATVTVQPNLGHVLGHDATLTQILLNLLNNALKYAKLGTPPVISITSEKRAGTLRLRVQDNGIGIPPEYHEKVFELFERLPDRAHQPGTGIGLAIVAKAIEHIGGRVGVDSVPGVGSTFWFELPAVVPVETGRPDRSTATEVKIPS